MGSKESDLCVYMSPMQLTRSEKSDFSGETKRTFHDRMHGAKLAKTNWSL